MKKTLWVIGLVFVLACNPVYAAEKGLALEEAIDLALKYSPRVQGAQADYHAAIGQRRQAGMFPNPSIGFEAENVAGTNAYNGIDNGELTVGLNQLVPIGGKRPARIQAAEHGQHAARYGQLVAQLDLVRDVKTAFADAVAAQEQADIMQQQEKLARNVFATVDKRVTAAAEPLVQRSKARIALANAELIAQRAKGQKDASLKVLATLWNDVQMPTSLKTGTFYEIKAFKLDSDLQQALRNAPDYKQQSLGINQAQSLLTLEQANAIPDPTFSLGVRELRASNDQALVAGVSFPLPVLNLNQGNIETARQQLRKAETDRQKTLLARQADFARYMQSLQNAYLTAKRIKADILPQAQEAFRQAQRGYEAGKFAYLEVLDAQRTLTDTRIAYIQALRDYHVNRAEAERLTGQLAPQEKN